MHIRPYVRHEIPDDADSSQEVEGARGVAPGSDPTDVLPVRGQEEPTRWQPAERPAARAATGIRSERLALIMPWRQQVTLPDSGELIIGREESPLQGHPIAREKTQIGRRHARVSRLLDGGLVVEDLKSLNGTFLDGQRVGTEPRRLRAGQTLRLAQDVECTVVRLNEYGEPDEEEGSA